MADFNHFGGSEEENAEIRRLNTEVVRGILYRLRRQHDRQLRHNLTGAFDCWLDALLTCPFLLAGCRSRQLRGVGKAGSDLRIVGGRTEQKLVPSGSRDTTRRL